MYRHQSCRNINGQYHWHYFQQLIYSLSEESNFAVGQHRGFHWNVRVVILKEKVLAVQLFFCRKSLVIELTVSFPTRNKLTNAIDSLQRQTYLITLNWNATTRFQSLRKLAGKIWQIFHYFVSLRNILFRLGTIYHYIISNKWIGIKLIYLVLWHIFTPMTVADNANNTIRNMTTQSLICNFQITSWMLLLKLASVLLSCNDNFCGILCRKLVLTYFVPCGKVVLTYFVPCRKLVFTYFVTTGVVSGGE